MRENASRVMDARHNLACRSATKSDLWLSGSCPVWIAGLDTLRIHGLSRVLTLA